MQVKKFEATTMQEALEMIKNTLGPEAIILNAKDNTGSFGLMGRKSIEVTAAISEQQLQKKQWAESRLKEEDLLKHRNRSARIQKQFIEKSVDRYTQRAHQDEIANRPVTRTRYIDIEDEEGTQSLRNARGRTVDAVLKDISKDLPSNMDFRETERDFRHGLGERHFIEDTQSSLASSAAAAKASVDFAAANPRVKMAVQSAYKVFEDSVDVRQEKVKPTVSSSASLNEVQSLKNEISQLRTILQSMSQTQNVAAKETPHFKLHPGAEYGVSYEMSSTFHKLTQAGISIENMLELLEYAKKELGAENTRKISLLEGWIAKTLMSQLQIKDATKTQPIHVFMGPSGGGKSSALIKLASYYVLNKNKRVGILTADTNKVGSVEQLRIYAQILNVPFGILKSKEDWSAIVDSLKGLDVILIDYPGLSLKEMEQVERLRTLLPADSVPCEKHLVLAATLKEKDAFEITERYKIAKPTDVIFTKLDEAMGHGLIYNFQRKYDLPLHSFGTGTQLPEDMEFATKERIVDLIFKITNLSK